MLLSNTNTTFVRFSDLHFVFYFLNIYFFTFFPLIGSKTVDRVKKIKRVRLALKVGTRIQLKISNSLSVCTSGVFTNVFSVN